jgi:ATP-binding cassette subfamily B (MDR/TAP) protein 1
MLGCSILALVTGWKLGLVAIFGVLLPVSAAGYLNFRQHRWFEESIEGANTESSSFASEAVGAIKTVATLTLEEVVYEKYRLIMHNQRRSFLKRNAVAFTFSSLSQSIDLLGMALIFWYVLRVGLGLPIYLC